MQCTSDTVWLHWPQHVEWTHCLPPFQMQEVPMSSKHALLACPGKSKGLGTAVQRMNLCSC